MNPVENYSQWGYWDRLDGTNLTDGEPVTVRWPTGEETPERIDLDKKTFIYGDMGHDCTGQDHQAYVTVLVRGVQARIRLYESGCLVERRTP